MPALLLGSFALSPLYVVLLSDFFGGLLALAGILRPLITLLTLEVMEARAEHGFILIHALIRVKVLQNFSNELYCFGVFQVCL